VILLDTHTLIWMDGDNPKLGPKARRTIEHAWPDGKVAVSAISFWECAMLLLRGRVELPAPVSEWRLDLLEAGIIELPLNGEAAMIAAQIEMLHKDPADRFIVATASCHDATLLTADQRLLAWNNPLKRQNALT
jgi:PIN domain nuclease of toxin-antitoxin system